MCGCEAMADARYITPAELSPRDSPEKYADKVWVVRSFGNASRTELHASEGRSISSAGSLSL